MGKFVLFALLAGCGRAGISGPGGFTPNTELALPPQQLLDGGADLSVIELLLATIDQGALTCSQFPDGMNPVSSTGRALGIVVAHLDGTAVGVGEYPVVFVPNSGPLPDAGNKLATLLLTDSTNGALGLGVSGSLTLTEVSPNLVGSFNSTLQSGDGGTWGTLSGSFDAKLCPTLNF